VLKTLALLLTLSAALCVSAVCGSVAAQTFPNIAGVWWTKFYAPALVPDGALPFTDKGKAAYAANIAGLKDGTIKDDYRRLCLPAGMPRMMATPYPFKIAKSKTGYVMLFEQNHVVRWIFLDRPMPEEDDILPYYMGNSHARWDGETLVVETAGFAQNSFLDATGVPHSDALKVEERIRLINPNQLEDVITVTDPEIFVKPVTVRYVYERRDDVKLTDFVCGEKHRDLSGVTGAP
jgi:hypothetical protein